MRTHMNNGSNGFTLVEMIVVIVIMGILGGVIALFIRWPVQSYVDSARRAGMNDIADAAMSRLTRDLRTALPNSVRVTTAGSTYYLEFIPVTSGGHYSVTASGVGYFDVLGPVPGFSASSSVAINHTDNTLVYNGNNYADVTLATASQVTFTPTATFPSASPGNRFQVFSRPVTYACDSSGTDSTGNGAGALTRYWGYAIQAAQPTALATLESVNSGAKLATNVSACKLSTQTLQSNELVSLQLTITESDESLSLYDEVHVDNVP